MKKLFQTEPQRQVVRQRVHEILDAFKQHPECKTTEEVFAVMGWKFAEPKSAIDRLDRREERP